MVIFAHSLNCNPCIEHMIIVMVYATSVVNINSFMIENIEGIDI